MPKSDLIFGSFNTSTSSGKYYKTQPINFPTPERAVEVFTVPGRSGDLVVDYGSYNNVELTAEIVIQATSPDTFLTLYDKLRTAVMVQSGYQRLEDSLYSGEYRMARAVGVEMKQTDTMNGTATITFDAKPQRYLTSGESVALSLDTSAFAFWRTFTGPGGIIFNNATLNALKAAGVVNPESLNFMVVDITPYIGGQEFLVLTYPPNSGITLSDGTQHQILLGRDEGSPFAGEVSSNPVIDTATVGATNTFAVPYGTIYNWMYFILTDTAELWDGHDIHDELTPVSGTVTAPANVLSYSPVIHFKVSGAVNGPGCFLDDSYIVLHTPASVSGVTLTDVYVDLETFNAYTTSGGMIYNLNPYVELYGDFTFFGNIEVKAGASVNKVEIIPKWWTI